MQKFFNTECACNPDRDYMVDISAKFLKAKQLIDLGKYFIINRARQFGKTTMLSTILRQLKEEYLVISISFESTTSETWQDQRLFCSVFCTLLENALLDTDANNEYVDYWHNASKESLTIETLSPAIKKFCKNCQKNVVLLIDEVDSASNNDLFVKFLAMLREMYNQRVIANNYRITFYSVVLAGVYDVRHLKLKIRPDEEARHNSPWNEAADFNVDMTFNPQEIATMLREYEDDHHTGMDIMLISNEIYKFTSGYPYLVSKICEIVDKDMDGSFTVENIRTAINNILNTDVPLLNSIIGKIEKYPELRKLVCSLVIDKDSNIVYEPANPTISLASMFCVIRTDENYRIAIHNIVFEKKLINYLISIEKDKGFASHRESSYFDKYGNLDMPMVLSRFQDLMHSEFRDRNTKFIEQQGRLLFLCFLKPIINGTGFYYVEPQIRENRRMDLVVIYNRKEYVIELKIWHGTEYETEGKVQLSEYLETRQMSEGYLVTFSFLKDKQITKASWIEYNGKRIFEAVI